MYVGVIRATRESAYHQGWRGDEMVARSMVFPSLENPLWLSLDDAADSLDCQLLKASFFQHENTAVRRNVKL